MCWLKMGKCFDFESEYLKEKRADGPRVNEYVKGKGADAPGEPMYTNTICLNTTVLS